MRAAHNLGGLSACPPEPSPNRKDCILNARFFSRGASAVFVAGLLASGAAQALDQATVNVSGSITDVCKFTVNTSNVTVTMDQNSSAPAVVSIDVQPKFWCTKDATVVVSDNGGANKDTGNASSPWRMKSGTNYIPYVLTYTAGHTGQGKSTEITMDLSISVPNANFIDKPSGTYGDTVTLTVNP